MDESVTRYVLQALLAFDLAVPLGNNFLQVHESHSVPLSVSLSVTLTVC